MKNTLFNGRNPSKKKITDNVKYKDLRFLRHVVQVPPEQTPRPLLFSLVELVLSTVAAEDEKTARDSCLVSASTGSKKNQI